MPGQDRGGLDDGQAGPPTGPDVGQPDPEDPVPASEPGLGDGALKDRELMAQGQVLEGDGRRPEEHGAEEGPEADPQDHQSPPASRFEGPSWDSTGSALEVVREV